MNVYVETNIARESIMPKNAIRINLLDPKGHKIWVHIAPHDAEMIEEAAQENGWTHLGSEREYCAGIEDDGRCWCQRNG